MAMDCIAMDLVQQGFVVGNRKIKTVHRSGAAAAVGLLHKKNPPHFVVIKLSNGCFFKYIILLTFLMFSLPWLGSMTGEGSAVHNQGVEGSSSSSSFPSSVIIDFKNVNPIKVEMMPLLFRDFTNEGLLRLRDRVLIVNNGGKNEELAIHDSLHILRDNEIDVIPRTDSERKRVINDQIYDFAFTNGFHSDIEFIDRVLNVAGIVVVQLKGNLMASSSIQKPSNYEIVYLRQFDSRFDLTIIAMRKMGMSMENTRSINVRNNEFTNLQLPRRKLCGISTEEKRAAALNKLESVLLEPPRSASGKSSTYSKRTRFLPDLMEDSLESYPRRVFIDITGDEGWFAKNYPTKNKDFEIYQVETTIAADGDNDDEAAAAMESFEEIEISDWLRENVKTEEYVVMKAEAEVVEEIVRNKAIGLVDELFLECNVKGMKRGKRSRRPYWECLALYGKLRDEGVAVHQWWG